MGQQPQRASWPELERLRDLQGHPDLIEQFYEAIVNEIAKVGEDMFNDPDIEMILRNEYSGRIRILKELLRVQTEYVRALLQEARPEEMQS